MIHGLHSKHRGIGYRYYLFRVKSLQMLLKSLYLTPESLPLIFGIIYI